MEDREGYELKKTQRVGSMIQKNPVTLSTILNGLQNIGNAQGVRNAWDRYGFSDTLMAYAEMPAQSHRIILTPQTRGLLERGAEFVREASGNREILPQHMMLDSTVSQKYALLTAHLAKAASGGAAYQGPIQQNYNGNNPGRGTSRRVWFTAGIKIRRNQAGVVRLLREWFSHVYFVKNPMLKMLADKVKEKERLVKYNGGENNQAALRKARKKYAEALRNPQYRYLVHSGEPTPEPSKHPVSLDYYEQQTIGVANGPLWRRFGWN